jgi:hypothetical protein
MSTFVIHDPLFCKKIIQGSSRKKLNSAFYSEFGNFVIIPLFIRQQHFKGRNHRSLPNHKTIFQKIHSTSKIKTLASSIFAQSTVELDFVHSQNLQLRFSRYFYNILSGMGFVLPIS